MSTDVYGLRQVTGSTVLGTNVSFKLIWGPEVCGGLYTGTYQAHQNFESSLTAFLSMIIYHTSRIYKQGPSMGG